MSDENEEAVLTEEMFRAGIKALREMGPSPIVLPKDDYDWLAERGWLDQPWRIVERYFPKEKPHE